MLKVLIEPIPKVKSYVAKFPTNLALKLTCCPIVPPILICKSSSSVATMVVMISSSISLPTVSSYGQIEDEKVDNGYL